MEKKVYAKSCFVEYIMQNFKSRGFIHLNCDVDVAYAQDIQLCISNSLKIFS